MHNAQYLCWMPYVVQSIYSDTLFEFAGSKTHIRAQEEQHQFYQKQEQLLPRYFIL